MALSKSTMLELSDIDGRVKTSGTSMEGGAESFIIFQTLPQKLHALLMSLVWLLASNSENLERKE